ncbi:hypothetical protein F7725_004303, partial [Dissostichus mawsoni]
MCYYGKSVTLQCTEDGQFIVVVAKDAILPNLDLETVFFLGGEETCNPVGTTSAFAIYQFPTTACGTVMMEEPGVIIYENRMSSSYEVAIGPNGAITRDSQYEYLFCRYIGTSIEALIIEVGLVPPPPPVAAPGPLHVELVLANGECSVKGCVEEEVAYNSFYVDSDYPVTKVLRDPVYAEVHILERTDPNIILTLGRCWATSAPDPQSLPQWDLLIDGCPYRDDRYLTALVPVDASSGLMYPTHYRRFVFKMFTFVSGGGVKQEAMIPLNEKGETFLSRKAPEKRPLWLAARSWSSFMTLQCTKDGQFIVVVAKDATLPNLDLETVFFLGGEETCNPVGTTSAFAIYQFPTTACGTVMMEEPGVIIYENRMSSSYEVAIGPNGAITRDSQYEYLFLSRLAWFLHHPQWQLQDPCVELVLANGECSVKGCVEAEEVAYNSFYVDSDYPVTKVLRDPVYAEVHILERTDPNIILTLGRCWATSAPDPQSLPQWDLLIDGCPYRDDRYLTALVPVDASSGLMYPTHHRRFVFKMFTFVSGGGVKQVYIHCEAAVCQPSLGDNCEPSLTATDHWNVFYTGRDVSVQKGSREETTVVSSKELCTEDGQFIVVVAKDAILPNLDLETVFFLGGEETCNPVGTTSAFAIYQFPTTACGTVMMEEPGVIIYENRMSSSYEVAIGPNGAITRDSQYEYLFCRYIGTSIEALIIEVGLVPPPPPVAAPGPLHVELVLANGECSVKGCVEEEVAYNSFYVDSDYPVTKVLRDPVYAEVHILERTDPNIILTLGRCWATSAPDPQSLPQWDLLIDGCPYRDDRYLTALVPVDASSGLMYPTHYRRFVFKMFTFVSGGGVKQEAMIPLNEKVYIHCEAAVCQPSVGDNCEPSLTATDHWNVFYTGRDVSVQKGSREETTVCTKDGQFIVVVAKDATLPNLDLETVFFLGGEETCNPVGTTSAFAIYQFPTTACGTVMMEEPGVIIYENRMSSSYEVAIGPNGAITRDSQYELLVQCRYIGTSIEALVIEVGLVPPPPPVAAPGPLRVELVLANGECSVKGCVEAEEVAYNSFYVDSEYPVTKVLRDPVYAEVHILERTDPNYIDSWKMLGNFCSRPSNCPYRDDRYLTALVPVDASSGLMYPTHYRRFVFKMFTFVSGGGVKQVAMTPLNEK